MRQEPLLALDTLVPVDVSARILLVLDYSEGWLPISPMRGVFLMAVCSWIKLFRGFGWLREVTGSPLFPVMLLAALVLRSMWLLGPTPS
jgi:hypothetical protein